MWYLKKKQVYDMLKETSLVIQWLRLCAFNPGGTGLIPGWGTKIPYVMWHSQKIKKFKTTMGIIRITVTTKKILLHEDKVWEVRSRKENKGCWYFSIKFSLKVLPYYQKKKKFSHHTMMPLFIKFSMFSA